MSGKADVVVLGAGIVGISAALHLQERGRDVAVVEREREAGTGTSYGNAGLIERSSIYPYAFPRDLLTIARYAMNSSTDAHYHPSALPGLAPFMIRYYFNSSPAGVARIARDARPLIEHSLIEHERLIAAAGATGLMRKVGWIKAFRTSKSFDKGRRDAARLRGYDLDIEELDPAALAEREPHLGEGLIGALHFHDPGAISDPGGLVQSYNALFQSRGGRFLQGDATTLEQDVAGLAGEDARRLARGPRGRSGARPLVGPRLQGAGLPPALRHQARLPSAFRLEGQCGAEPSGARLRRRLPPGPDGQRHPPHDGSRVRPPRSPPTPVQLARALPTARSLYPLADPVEDKPWMGSRPCLPDMLPIIGRAPKHDGIWFDFGHQHHGLTLGPVSGRLLAEQMTGEQPFTDPAPYRMERFG